MAVKSLKTVLRDIDHNDDSLWTSSGHPRVAAVNELAGEGAAYTAEDIAAAGVTRAPASEAPGQAGAARHESGALKDETEKETPTEGEAAATNNKPLTPQMGESFGSGTVSNQSVFDNGVDQPKDNQPRITAKVEAQDSDRVAAVGDDVIVFTPNPIDGNTRHEARITRLNVDSSVNVEIKTATGRYVQFSGVASSQPAMGTPQMWFAWPAEKA